MNKAYIFDIDGVIINLLAQEVKEFEILDIIKDKLRADVPIAFITGRGTKWFQNALLSKLNLGEEEKNLFVAAEFGGVILHFQEDTFEPTVDSQMSVPETIKAKATEILDKYKDFVKEEKLTLITYKIKDGVKLSSFKDSQNKALNELKKLYQNPEFNSLEIQRDSIAINVRNKKSTKYTAVKKFLLWLGNKNIEPESYIVFGDSDSDFEMGEELISQKKRFEFIFVGQELEKKPSFPIVSTKAKNDLGTLEYLKTESS